MPKVRYAGAVDNDETPLEEARRLAAERKSNRAFEVASDVEEMSSELGRATQFDRVDGSNFYFLRKSRSLFRAAAQPPEPPAWRRMESQPPLRRALDGWLWKSSIATQATVIMAVAWS